MVNVVVISKGAQKDLRKVPALIRDALAAWIREVKRLGLAEVRKIPGYHDEPLRGARKGQRSIRLNKAWRAVYVIKADGSIEFVELLEVNKHDY